MIITSHINNGFSCLTFHVLHTNIHNITSQTANQHQSPSLYIFQSVYNLLVKKKNINEIKITK